MRQPTTILTHAGGLCLRAERLGVRARAARPGEQCGLDQPPALRSQADDLTPGVRRLDELEIDLGRVDLGESVRFLVTVRNASKGEICVDSVMLGFRFEGYGSGPLRFLRHGWQSWSSTGARDLDPAGTPEFPSGAWLRGMHHALNVPAADRAGWHESHIVTVAGGAGGACLAGALETGRSFGLVYLRELRGADPAAAPRPGAEASRSR